MDVHEHRRHLGGPARLPRDRHPPRPGGAVTTARATFTSVYGPVSTSWRQRSGRFTLTCSVPPNTTAEVWIPASTPDAVTRTHGTYLRQEDGCAVYRVGSGTHRFTT